MTQDEAKTKWCPKAKSNVLNVAVNRNMFGEPDGGCLCLASDCTLWIWTKTRDHSRGPDCTMPKAEWQGQCGLIRTEGAY